MWNVSWKQRLLKIIELVLIFSSFACGSSNVRQQDLAAIGQPDAPYVQPAFQAHLSTFTAEASMRGVVVDTSKLTIVFKNLSSSSDLLGECNPSYNLVEIDEQSWNSKSNYQQEQILFHELGHCLLNRISHTTGVVNYLSKLIPISLMDSSGSTIYNENSRDYYLDELFDKSKSVNLTSDYIARHSFAIEVESIMTVAKVNSINTPSLAYIDSSGKMEYLDPSNCTVLGVTDLAHQAISNVNQVMNISSGLSLQFNQVGSYIVSFNCQGDTYVQAFTIQ